jgi:hypothetical protein
MSIDRRRTPRAPCDLPVEWRRGWKTVMGRARDLNADGFFLITPHTLELNFVMDVIVTLPDGPVPLLGVARYVGPTRHGRGIGVQIHAIAKEDRARWHAYHRAAVAEMLTQLPEPVARYLRARTVR